MHKLDANFSYRPFRVIVYSEETNRRSDDHAFVDYIMLYEKNDKFYRPSTMTFRTADRVHNSTSVNQSINRSER